MVNELPVLGFSGKAIVVGEVLGKMTGAPGLVPGFDALFEIGHDLLGDPCVNVGFVVHCSSPFLCCELREEESGIRAKCALRFPEGHGPAGKPNTNDTS